MGYLDNYLIQKNHLPIALSGFLLGLTLKTTSIPFDGLWLDILKMKNYICLSKSLNFVIFEIFIYIKNLTDFIQFFLIKLK